MTERHTHIPFAEEDSAWSPPRESAHRGEGQYPSRQSRPLPGVGRGYSPGPKTRLFHEDAQDYEIAPEEALGLAEEGRAAADATTGVRSGIFVCQQGGNIGHLWEREFQGERNDVWGPKHGVSQPFQSERLEHMDPLAPIAHDGEAAQHSNRPRSRSLFNYEHSESRDYSPVRSREQRCSRYDLRDFRDNREDLLPSSSLVSLGEIADGRQAIDTSSFYRDTDVQFKIKRVPVRKSIVEAVSQMAPQLLQDDAVIDQLAEKIMAKLRLGERCPEDQHRSSQFGQSRYTEGHVQETDFAADAGFQQRQTHRTVGNDERVQDYRQNRPLPVNSTARAGTNRQAPEYDAYYPRRSRSPPGVRSQYADAFHRQPIRYERNSTTRHDSIKCGYFDGTTPFEIYMSQFETCRRYNRWSDDDALCHLKASLRGVASQVLLTDCGNQLTLRELMDMLKQRFGNLEQSNHYRNVLRMRRRAPRESLQALYHDISKLVMMAHPGARTDLGDQLAVEAFVDALNDSQLQLRIKDRFPKNLDEAFRIAVLMESNQVNQTEASRLDTTRRNDRYAKTVTIDETQDEEPDQLRQPSNRRGSNRMDRRGRSQSTEGSNPLATSQLPTVSGLHDPQVTAISESVAECKAENQAMRRQLQELQAKVNTTSLPVPVTTKSPEQIVMCGSCGKRGHLTKNCRSAQASQNMTCFHCNQTGHFKRNCPIANAGLQYGGPPRFRSNGQQMPHREQGYNEWRAAPASATDAGEERTYLRLKIQRRPFDFLLDTGCQKSLIPRSYVPDANLIPSSRVVRAANGTLIAILGEVKFNLQLGRHRLPTSALVTEHVTEGMLGIEWLNQYKVKWDFLNQTLNFRGKNYKLRKKGEETSCCRLIVEDMVNIPPSSEAIVPASLRLNNLRYPESDLVTEPREVKPGLCVARAMLPRRCTALPVRVMNSTACAIILKKGEDLTEVRTAEVIGENTIQPDELLYSETLMNGVEVPLQQEEKEKLRHLLNSYSDIFSNSEFDLGTTRLVQHHIDTGNARPVRQALRRQPVSGYQFVEEHVQEMLRHGVIEESQSPWAANVVVVAKKDGTKRFCIDYRKLNDVTTKDAYPLPRIADCLDALGGARYFSTFDLRSGYHQVEVEPESRDKTSFVTRQGTFRFRKMSFGLCNAPATFSRLMNMVMSGLDYVTCLVYLDDILVFSRTVPEHLERLEILFKRLRRANLKLKPSKCKLLRSSVVFLGHVVTKDGISTDPEKISAVAEWPIPRNLTELRSFLGLCSYYRRFVRGYAEVAAPLHYLSQKNVKYKWTNEQQLAFDELKRRLTSSPILTTPIDEGEYRLDTDASNNSIGAVLSQVQEGEERVIAYASRTLSGPEKNYCATRRELLAVVFYINQFRSYILGREFVVRTDHSALQWLRRTPEAIGQQARWLEKLEEYTFKVEHRPGRKHGNADALSRKPCRQCGFDDEPQSSFATVAAVEVSENSSDETQNLWEPCVLAAAQASDPDIGPFYGLFSANEEQVPWAEIIAMDKHTKLYWTLWDRLRMQDNILYRKWEDADGTSHKWLLIVPKSHRKALFEQIHPGATGGHLGIKKTQAQIKRRAYWSGWAGDVARFCRQCQTCARYHRGKLTRQGGLNPMVVGEPMERLSVDLTGPHPRSRNGFVYILTIVDVFTKWAEAVPLRNHEAPTVAKALVNNVLLRLGMPHQILTDRGGEFEGQLMTELCRLLQIDKIRTTSYKPSTNGAVERFHRTLNSMLGKAISEDQRDWDEMLPSIMAAYRSSKHEATGYSPNCLMLGREVRAPADLVLGLPEDEEGRVASVDEFVEKQSLLIRDSYRIARENLGKSAQRAKEYYDRKVKSAAYSVNQWVWYYTPRRYVGRSPKWQKTYDGPFLITKILGPVDAVLQKTRKSQSFVAHIDKLKPCLGETPVSWIAEESELGEVLHPTGTPFAVEDKGAALRNSREVRRKSYAWIAEEPTEVQRPRRNVNRPTRFRNFDCSFA